MDFLQKVDFMMEKYNLNKSSLSQNSGIPYTTIDGWYKKGYEGLKLTTLKKLSEYFNTLIDFWVLEDVTDPNYGKANGFELVVEEAEHIQKYRLIDDYGKEAVDSVLEIEYRRYIDSVQAQQAAQRAKLQQSTEEISEEIMPEILFFVPEYQLPISAGPGEEAGLEAPEDLRLVRQPPRGTSYVARVHGDSMEPTYHNGDRVFVHATTEILPGQIGVFLMDGQQWIKELGDHKLISHNIEYAPIPMRDDIRCQGLVLGPCDSSYFRRR